MRSNKRRKTTNWPNYEFINIYLKILIWISYRFRQYSLWNLYEDYIKFKWSSHELFYKQKWRSYTSYERLVNCCVKFYWTFFMWNVWGWAAQSMERFPCSNLTESSMTYLYACVVCLWLNRLKYGVSKLTMGIRIFCWSSLLVLFVKVTLALVQVMDWGRPGDKQLSEPMMVHMTACMTVCPSFDVHCMLWIKFCDITNLILALWLVLWSNIKSTTSGVVLGIYEIQLYEVNGQWDMPSCTISLSIYIYILYHIYIWRDEHFKSP